MTGIGLLTPLGIGVKENWTNLLAGKSGTVTLDSEGILFEKEKNNHSSNFGPFDLLKSIKAFHVE